MLTKAPRGTRDILPGEARKWHFLENKARDLCNLYGYGEIRTPVFEHTELFQRGVGEGTDIVSKEMYTFTDRGERQLTLRPENTAAVVRAYLENKMNNLPQPVKLFYLGPMFRYDRPQAGRYRQFHQFGVESFGSYLPSLDAEIIHLANSYYQALGLKDLTLEINSVGCSHCRPKYRESLKGFLQERVEELCGDCQKRFDKNVLRVLDCKKEKCRTLFNDIPLLGDNLCQECHEHFHGLQKELDKLELVYKINPFMVRGLDYYTKTVFEFISDKLGAQSSLGGGGRYDDLVELFGGPLTPGTGFALGMERILLALKEEGAELDISPIQAYLAVIEEERCSHSATRFLHELRIQGISCDRDYMGRSLKSQLKQANRLKVPVVIIFGGEELKDNKVIIKKMSTGEQETCYLTDVVARIRNV